MLRKIASTIVISVSLVIPLTAFGAEEELFTPPTNEQPGIPKAADDFLGLGFGVGISLTVDRGGEKDRVDSASVVNGIVRVEDENNTRSRIMLESHYFFPTRHSFIGTVAKDNWGHGPFVAIQPGTDEIIEAVGIGWMIGFKRSNVDTNSSGSWNFGLGFIVDPNVKVLGDGIEENKPLPVGETSVRFKEETETGYLFLVSFKF